LEPNNLIAQTRDVSLICEGTLDLKKLSWSGDWETPPSGKVVVGCYKPLYGYYSPSTYYSPGAAMGAPPPTVKPDSSDGSESVDVPIYFNGGILIGVYVYFQYGNWERGPYGTPEYYNYYRQADVVACPAVWISNPGGHCFSRGTMVKTPDGTRAIEAIVPGDAVFSAHRDEFASVPAVRRVKRVTKSQERLLDLNLDGRVIRTTHNHPVFAKQKGWTPAGMLEVGDLLRCFAHFGVAHEIVC
jgi:hypothetical protein